MVYAGSQGSAGPTLVAVGVILARRPNRRLRVSDLGRTTPKSQRRKRHGQGDASAKTRPVGAPLPMGQRAPSPIHKHRQRIASPGAAAARHGSCRRASRPVASGAGPLTQFGRVPSREPCGERAWTALHFNRSRDVRERPFRERLCRERPSDARIVHSIISFRLAATRGATGGARRARDGGTALKLSPRRGI